MKSKLIIKLFIIIGGLIILKGCQTIPINPKANIVELSCYFQSPRDKNGINRVNIFLNIPIMLGNIKWTTFTAFDSGPLISTKEEFLILGTHGVSIINKNDLTYEVMGMQNSYKIDRVLLEKREDRLKLNHHNLLPGKCTVQ